jgi:hypothetical protein
MTKLISAVIASLALVFVSFDAMADKGGVPNDNAVTNENAHQGGTRDDPQPTRGNDWVNETPASE